MEFLCQRDEIQDPELLASVAAEVVTRAWLTKRSEPWPVGMLPEQVLPVHLEIAIRDWLSLNQQSRCMDHGIELPDASSAGYQTVSHLNHGLQSWRAADGFIPLVLRNHGSIHPQEAVAVPFVLALRTRRDDPFVVTVDSSGQEVVGLRQSWDTAWAVAKKAGWVNDGDLLQIRLLSLSPLVAGFLEGASATLPFLIAIRFRQKGIKPPSLGWAASGAPGQPLTGCGGGHPMVEWRAKGNLIAAVGVPLECCLLPEPGSLSEPDLLAERVAAFADQFLSSSVRLSQEDVERELESLDESMRFGRQDYEAAAARLDHLAGLSEQSTSLRWVATRGKVMKLRADVYCHQGMPERAIHLLEKFGEPNTSEECEAVIRVAVARTDQCEYSSAESLATEALHAADRLSPVSAAEIRMKALGSRGQAKAYHALETGDARMADEARVDLEMAIEQAVKLDEGASNGRSNVARNLTYQLLWHALFRPSEAGLIYEQALELATSAPHGPGFVHRVAHLARYRSILLGFGPELPWWPENTPDIPDPDFADGWLAATALKYRGTYRAKLGDFEGAKRDFDEASAILKPAGGWLLAFIRGTILLQAGESLSAENHSASVEFLRESVEIFEAVKGLNQIHPESAVAPDRWLLRARHLLDGSSAPQTNPQLLYQY